MRRVHILVALLTCLLLPRCLALCLDPTQTRFVQWFPQYRQRLAASAQNCQAEIYNYRHSISTPGCAAPCACAADCVLANATETMKANMGAASVLLGLMPVVLPFMGPTLAEVALLSSQRPVLALLLAFGTPALNPYQLFAPLGARETVRAGTGSLAGARVLAGLEDGGLAVWLSISVLEYFVACAASFAQIAATVVLGLRTVVSWRCNVHFLVLTWLMLSIVPHLAGIVSFWCTIRPRVRVDHARAPSPAAKANPGVRVGVTESTPGRLRWCAEAIRAEVHPCSSPHFRRPKLPEPRHSVTADLWNWAASVLTVAHMIFGIVLLSAVLFISTLDALTVVLAYIIPAALCRVIMLFELAGIRSKVLVEP